MGGGGEDTDKDRRRQNSQQDGRVQQGRGARSDHKNTLPLGGRVEGQVRLYGERGRGGGRQRDGHRKIRRGKSSVDKGTLTRATPSDELRDSRPSREAPSTSPLHPHPCQVPPATQVEGGCKPAYGTLGQETRRGHWSADRRMVGSFPTDGRWGTDDGRPDAGGGRLNTLKRAERRQIGRKERGDGQDACRARNPDESWRGEKEGTKPSRQET